MKRLAFVALAAAVLVGCKDAMQVEVLTPIDPFCIAPPSGIVSWWPGEGSASDVVGPNDSELTNGSTFAPGKVGLAFSLDAVDDVVNGPAEIIGDLQQLTVEVWVNIEGRAGPGCPHSPGSGPQWMWFSGGQRQCRIKNVDRGG